MQSKFLGTQFGGCFLLCHSKIQCFLAFDEDKDDGEDNDEILYAHV